MKFLISILLTFIQVFSTYAMFEDVTPPNFAPPNIKFGGPAIADLDGNGYPDLILGYHGGAPVEVYFNFDGDFTRSKFKAGGDMHAYVPFRASPTDKGMHFTISRGGRKGTFPRSPVMFSVDPATREFQNVTDESGITVRTGRGRSALYVDMSMGGKRSTSDVIYTNSDPAKCPTCTGPRHHSFVNGRNGLFKTRDVPGLTDSEQNGATVVDVDGDGIMEIVMFAPGLQIFKLISPFKAHDISADVLPTSVLEKKSVQSIAELDFDNDGDFDLYIAIGKSGRRDRPNKGDIGRDILLENRGGVFVDVSESAGIPTNTFSYGVTAADFNNDGYMDIFITMYDSPDVLLRNNGDGSFTIRKGVIDRPSGVPGDMAQAVDYDGDGRVDLIASQGDRTDRTLLGMYRVFKNVLTGADLKGSFVLVRVGSSPKRRAVGLHAVVTAKSGTKTWVRRVGSPGVAISASYIELIHFGIGKETLVDISVRWVNGEKVTVQNVEKGSKITVGGFGKRNAVRKSRKSVQQR